MMPPARLLAILPAPMKVILVVMGKEVPAYRSFVFQPGDKCPPKAWRFRDEFVTGAGVGENGRRDQPAPSFCGALPCPIPSPLDPHHFFRLRSGWWGFVPSS